MLRLNRLAVVWCFLVVAALACAREGTEVTGPGESPMAATPSGPNEAYASVFVRYSADAPRSRIEMARAQGARFAHDLTRSRWLALELPRRALHALDRLPWVEQVEVDTSVVYLAGDVYPWGIDSSGARAVHSYARGSGVKIAFLDGGTRCTYSDLIPRVVGGYDFEAGSSAYCQNTMTSTASLDHGTSVAQVLAASINGVDFVGMAPEANLYNLRVCVSPSGGAPTECSMAMIAAALDWALANGMQVVSASLQTCGTALPQAIKDAMGALYAANIVQVWAGGNGTWNCANTSVVSSFITEPGVIAVTAYGKGSGHVPEFGHNSFLDLAAPTGVERQSIFGGTTCCFDGTSASTPHVAGAAALMIGLGFSGVDLITQRLTTTAEDRGTAGFDIYYGYGVLDVDSAAKRKPSIMMLNGAPQPIKVAGTYPLSSVIANGVAPFQVQWTVHYSSGLLPDVNTSFGANALNMEVPDGSYAITVRATPREVTYLRTGTAIQVDFPVCTGGGGGDLVAGMRPVSGLRSTGSAAGGDVTPNAVGGC